MYSVMLVEDEVHILKYMKKKLDEFEELNVVGTFSSPEEALSAFDTLQPDVVFLDIEMPRIDGLELARGLLAKKNNLHIIFTTAYRKYAVDAFDIEAIDYLMKPIVDDDVKRVIKRLHKVTDRNKAEKAEPIGTRNTFVPIRCFGGFELRDHNQQLITWPTRRAEELFAYFLLHQGQYVSKWALLELFWNEMDEEKALHNLYNTIYRIKQVLKKLPAQVSIKKVNDGYILESKEELSDFERLINFVERKNVPVESALEEAVEIFFSYRRPLFGARDYAWGLSTQGYAARLYRRLCKQLIGHYRQQDQFSKAEELVRYYITQHVEDEDMMLEWLQLLKDWKGHQEKIIIYKELFNEELRRADLPGLKR